MRKLLISNTVTAIIVLGVIAAYSFSKPDGKGGAKYASVTVNINHPFYTIVIAEDGKAVTINDGKDMKGDIPERTLATNQQLEKLEAEGYQLVGVDVQSSANLAICRRTYTFRKQ